MATSDTLLSTKTQEKPEEIDSNPEDKDATEVGGPESEWTTAQYANMSFVATTGVKPDTTILSKAKVKAEPIDVVKEEAESDDEEDDLKEEIPVVTETDDEDEEFTIEGDDAPVDSDSKEESDVDVPAEDEDDTLEISLADLVSGEDMDTEMLGDDPTKDPVEIKADEAADPMAVDDQDLLTVEGDDEIVDMDETDDMESMFKEAGDDEESLPIEKDLEEEDDKEAEDDEDDDEKKEKDVVKEGKLRIKFKIAETKTLFENNTTLSEEDKRQSRVIFESAVRSVATSIGKQLNEAYQARFTRKQKLQEKKLVKQVDRYMSYAVENWLKENRVGIQHELRNRLSENFMRGLKNLFVEHYVDVPQSKVNVVESLAKNVKSLKSQLQESERRAVKLHQGAKAAVIRERKALRAEHKARLIAEAKSAVVAADRGEFAQRAANLKFTTTSAFKKDLVALREQYFGVKKSAGRSTTTPDAAPLFEGKHTQRTAVDGYLAAMDKLSGQP